MVVVADDPSRHLSIGSPWVKAYQRSAATWPGGRAAAGFEPPAGRAPSALWCLALEPVRAMWHVVGLVQQRSRGGRSRALRRPRADAEAGPRRLTDACAWLPVRAPTIPVVGVMPWACWNAVTAAVVAHRADIRRGDQRGQGTGLAGVGDLLLDLGQLGAEPSGGGAQLCAGQGPVGELGRQHLQASPEGAASVLSAATSARSSVPRRSRASARASRSSTMLVT